MNLRRWFGGGDVRHPKTFNEKMQWLKIYDRNPLYVQLADKYSVRSFVEKRIGQEFLNDLLGVYSTPDEIDWSKLPKAFVLKATWGSGMNIFVRDKESIDRVKISRLMNDWLRIDYSKRGREWVYRDIPRRFIAERLILDSEGRIPYDYKIFCFDGEPRYIQVDVDRFGEHTRAYFDEEWRRQPFTILYRQFDGNISRPLHLDRMLEAARSLSKGIPFVRVDFYAIPKVIFGEMTFYPGNGTEPFVPAEWDQKLGKLIRLPRL